MAVISQAQIVPAAERMEQYLPLLQKKRVAVLINQTSKVGNDLLLDALLQKGIKVVKVFVPEHGFRGTADAGAHVKSETDEKTGLRVVSLYGKNRKPSKEQLADVDVLVYDLQDVGVRFYTYISSLQYAMEACAENGKEIVVLDRPNPNGFYVDGPVLDTSLRSFVGMQPIPIVYGMTVGEYAKMLIGEKWCTAAAKCKLTVIPCSGYDHTQYYTLPVSPSPNLKSEAAIYLYPSTCLFEGTNVSLGRGTDKPFQVWGHPDFKLSGAYTFTPQPNLGASDPQYKGRSCYGRLVASTPKEALKFIGNRIQLGPLLEAYSLSADKKTFFIPYFETLAGTRSLRSMIEKGLDETAIRATWQADVTAFKRIRKKYLLYKDFE